MKEFRTHPLDRQALRAMIHRFKRDDWQVLDDRALIAALDGTQPLSRKEWEALLDSPLTLRRMQVLEAVRRTKEDALQAANDAFWQASPGLLRAAAGSADAATLATDDGYWTLDFPRAQDGWGIVLRLEPSAPFAGEFIGEDEMPEVAVVDGSGRTLLIGELDEEGKLLARWPDAEAPLKVLSAAGGGFQVLRV
jgi:hypothetical protein